MPGWGTWTVFYRPGLQTGGPWNDSHPQVCFAWQILSQISHQRLKPKEFTFKFSFLACVLSRDLATLSPSPHLVTIHEAWALQLDPGPTTYHLPVWLISVMLNKRIFRALWAFAFANWQECRQPLRGIPWLTL